MPSWCALDGENLFNFAHTRDNQAMPIAVLHTWSFLGDSTRLLIVLRALYYMQPPALVTSMGLCAASRTVWGDASQWVWRIRNFWFTAVTFYIANRDAIPDKLCPGLSLGQVCTGSLGSNLVGFSVGKFRSVPWLVGQSFNRSIGASVILPWVS